MFENQRNLIKLKKAVGILYYYLIIIVTYMQIMELEVYSETKRFI